MLMYSNINTLLRLSSIILIVILSGAFCVHNKFDSNDIFGTYNRLPSNENNKFHSNSHVDKKYSNIKPEHGIDHFHSQSITPSSPFSSSSSLTSSSLSPSSSSSSSFFPTSFSSTTPLTNSNIKHTISSPDLSISHPLTNGQTGRIPLYLYNPGLARQIGLSTLMYGGIIYGLTIIPALLAATGIGPFAGLISSLGKKRKKRSMKWNYEMPLLDKLKTDKFLALLETTLENRRIYDEICKKYHACKVYQDAINSEEHPITLGTLERAIVNTFGVAAERKGYQINPLPTVRTYFEPALLALTGSNCTFLYPCKEDEFVFKKIH